MYEKTVLASISVFLSMLIEKTYKFCYKTKDEFKIEI